MCHMFDKFIKSFITFSVYDSIIDFDEKINNGQGFYIPTEKCVSYLKQRVWVCNKGHGVYRVWVKTIL